MKAGDVQTANKAGGKTVVLAVALWAKRKGDWIRIRIKGLDNSITTVTNDPESVRFHRTLFRNLRRTLINQDRWPFGDEGAETEVSVPTTAESPNSVSAVSRFHPIQLHGEGPTATDILLHDRARL